jgi:hypothetical protein
MVRVFVLMSWYLLGQDKPLSREKRRSIFDRANGNANSFTAVIGAEGSSITISTPVVLCIAAPFPKSLWSNPSVILPTVSVPSS